MTTPYSVPGEVSKLADGGGAHEKHAAGRLTIEDVPDKNLRFFLRWDLSTSKLNMGCNIVFGFLGPVPWMFMFFSAITNSLIVGGAIGAAMVCATPLWFSLKNGHPAALAFYVANPGAAKRIGDACRASVISNFTMSTMVSILSWIYLLEPWSQKRIFGAHSYAIVAALHWSGTIFGPLSGLFNQISIGLPKEVSIVWNKKITTYFEQIVTELLDVENGCKSAMARIAVHQREMEDFARGMSKVMAGINGGMTAFITCWVVITVGAIAIPSEATGSERGIQIGILAAMALFNMTFLISFFRAMASANHHWEHEKRRLLNDARISDLVGPRVYHWEKFDDWLEGHELSSSKAFGVRVTSRLLWNVGSLLVSAFAIVLYFLLREELRSLLA